MRRMHNWPPQIHDRLAFYVGQPFRADIFRCIKLESLTYALACG
jgi:hypothetical protein